MRTIRGQITCLLMLLMTAFLMLGIAWHIWEARRAGDLAAAAYRYRQQAISRLVELNGMSIQTLAEDYSYRDDMVRFISARDLKWAAQNIQQSLSTYKASAVWVYDRRSRKIYSTYASAQSVLADIPLEASQIERLFKHSRFCHFFVSTSGGPLEIRGATVHRSNDPARTGPWFGYMFVGRLWGAAYRNQLADLTGCRVELYLDNGTDTVGGMTMNSHYRYVISLPDYSGAVAARLRFTGEVPSLQLFHESARAALAIFAGFAIAVCAILFCGLHAWVRTPLTRLCASLKTHDTAHLEGMESSTTEYGELARLIETFFEQRQVLVGEVGDRVQAETALRQAHRELEVRVQERTAELQQAYAALQAEYQERKQAEDELSRAEAQLVQSAKLAALGTLCAGVAHELNQPVAVIRGLAQQMFDEPGLSIDVHGDLKLIEGQTSRMMKIIGHLRTFSRASRGEFETVDAHQIVRNCFVIIGQQLKAHNVIVNLQMDVEPQWVSGDTNELEQVFLNLISNARDATEGRSDACITISSRTDEGRVVLQFRDNGTGISDDAASRLFDPFYTTKEPGKGTGLGLSISHSIIQKHNGAIRAYNDGGAVFEVSLPRAEAFESEMEPPAQAA